MRNDERADEDADGFESGQAHHDEAFLDFFQQREAFTDAN